MDNFNQQSADFIPYFSSMAQISGSLLGLVFVALTFNIKTHALRDNIGIRSLAQQVFADFLMVMLISLLLLIPHTIARQISLILVIIAMVGMIRIARSVLALRRTSSARPLLQRFWLSLIGHVGILSAGVLLFMGDERASAAWSALLMSPLVLLIAGTRSAWMLIAQRSD